MSQAAATDVTHAADQTRPRNEGRAARSLDDLAALTPDELGALYASAGVPARLDELDGDLVGRMLAVRGTGGVVLRGLAAFSRRAGFPWEGKSFRATDARTGTGLNRVHLGGRHRLFPFRTTIGASVVDGRPAVILDYDDPDNPGFIRAVHDEVREVAPGLMFGPACWKSGRGKTGKVTVVAWFALDARGRTRAPDTGVRRANVVGAPSQGGTHRGGA